MKNVLWVRLLAFSSMLGISIPVMSQNSMKVISKTAAMASVSPAMRDFRKRFVLIDNEEWYVFPKGSAAIFTSGDVRFRVEYNGRGNWCSTEKDYKELQLDRAVRKVVKREYFDYTITWVKEFILPDLSCEPVYFIYLEDEQGFKTLCVYEYEIKVLDEFVKVTAPAAAKPDKHF